MIIRTIKRINWAIKTAHLEACMRQSGGSYLPVYAYFMAEQEQMITKTNSQTPNYI